MLNVPVYNESGKQIGQEQIDEALLGGELNPALLKQAVVMYHANRRQGTVGQKARSEVVGSSRKIFRQKGTGRARMGNVRNPIRRGGGRAFPRKPRDFRRDMPRKMRRLARNQAVLAKIRSQEALIVDAPAFEEPKTRRFAELLRALHADRGCVFATNGVDAALLKSGRNLHRAEVMNIADLNAFDILRRQRLVFTKDAFEAFRQAAAATVKAGE
ncbi:MAG: 50S ribosomal protein L4 [Phycisphaerae bacterium]